jgi:hypothetical protein
MEKEDENGENDIYYYYNDEGEEGEKEDGD